MTHKTSKINNKSDHFPSRPTKAKAAIDNPSRRSLLQWMGSAAVIALSSDLLTGCAEQNLQSRSGFTVVPPGKTLGSNEFPFTPTSDDDPIYDRWWGNTVDHQELEKILESWELRITGLVEQSVTLSFSDLLALPRKDQVTDFHCVEGWSVLDVPWNGVHINSIIDLVHPTTDATHLTIRCFSDVYSESIPLELALESRTLLAYGIGDGTLPLTHGFPLRLIVPRMYGYKSAKWVKEIEFTNAAIDGYWEQRGYPTDASVNPKKLREGKY